MCDYVCVCGVEIFFRGLKYVIIHVFIIACLDVYQGIMTKLPGFGKICEHNFKILN